MEIFDKVNIKDLSVGDIFAHEIKIQNREAFKVLDHITVKSTLCKSRTTGKEIKKQSDLKVYYLRHE